MCKGMQVKPANHSTATILWGAYSIYQLTPQSSWGILTNHISHFITAQRMHVVKLDFNYKAYHTLKQGRALKRAAAIIIPKHGH